MSHFQIGWAEYSLTPDKKVSLVGQFAERISEYVEKPLCVTAMAVSTDSDQAVFCSCDLVGVSWSLRDAVREKLAGNTVGLDPMKVIISAIHTHTGPGYTGRGNSSGRFSSNSSGKTEVMMTYIYKKFFGDGGASGLDFGYGAALTVVTAVILGIVTLLYLRATKKSSDVY